MEVIGKPTQKDIMTIESTNANYIITQLDCAWKGSFESFFDTNDQNLLDFLWKTLCFNVNKRLTVDQAL